MTNDSINICQVSLARDISLVKENYRNFTKFYRNLKFHIICPKKDVSLFQESFNFKNCKIINEDTVLSLSDFRIFFNELSANLTYKDSFEQRLSWYYQQVLKISYVIDFIDENNEKIIIWDADTIILKRIEFFNKNESNNFGTLFEFHRAYFLTIKRIFDILPPVFISSLTQFISISLEDNHILKKRLNNFIEKKSMNTSEWISKIVLRAVFDEHKTFNGSMFSEYELIGISKILDNKFKQKPLFTLRSGLDGKLSNFQKILCKFFNIYHVTYEHSHPNEFSKDMLKRQQNIVRFFRIILNDAIKFYLRNLRYQFDYYISSLKKRRGGREV